ncbi:histidinol-phosphatase [Myxococcus sp. AM009]|uniref:histidinol-phosphatase n=1 Tax=unclassified Myxococcus TaxID=2648731 RepID=UPI001594FBD3|nr:MULTISPECIES: histidinol-phosphatase [unclassified Myxococcus]NVI96575.1 histidinol-phosphatase [Myxococcus sp. AM009]NVJ12612.1 histidinol-phosphatase [Myxococcus sp. AM010]
MTDSGTLMQAAAEVARLAGDVALGFFRGGVAVDTKSDGSPVTVADRTAESRAREWLEARFPQDGILGEEFGETRPGAKRRWILDPIDGTKTFIRGVPLWGTLVALAEGERILVGAAYFPAVRELLVAAPGQGCFWNDRRAAVSTQAELSKAVVLSTDARFPVYPERGAAWRALARDAAVDRTWGDCYGYLLVATGRAEVMVDELLSPWDGAALQPIIEEAGGVFTDWTGRRTAFGGNGIATNAAMARVVRERLGAVETR